MVVRICSDNLKGEMASWHTLNPVVESCQRQNIINVYVCYILSKWEPNTENL